MNIIQRESLEHRLVPLSKDNGDPGMSLPVAIAIVAEGTRPTTSDFKTGSWEPSTFTSGGKTYRYAKILVAGSSGAADGTEDVTLVAGARYDVYAKVTDIPEVPVLIAGVLEVT